MNKKKYWIICLSLLVLCSIRSQNNRQTCINLYDKNKLKTGFWIESGYYDIEEGYYEKGLKQGVFKSFNKRTKQLEYFGEYKHNKKIGTTWYTFDEDGCFLLWKEKNIFQNTEKSKNEDGTPGGVFNYRSYVIMFYPNGEIQEEGIWIYDEFESDESESIGVHKYYDTYGNQLSIKPKGWWISNGPNGKLVKENFSKEHGYKERPISYYVNKYDQSGLKTGLWKDEKSGILAYYKNGKLNGVYRSFNKTTGKLECFGEYTYGNMTGTWFYFDEKSQLVMKVNK